MMEYVSLAGYIGLLFFMGGYVGALGDIKARQRSARKEGVRLERDLIKSLENLKKVVASEAAKNTEARVSVKCGCPACIAKREKSTKSAQA